MSIGRSASFVGPIVFDSGGLLAYAGRGRAVRDFCRAAVAAGRPLILPTVVYAQVERGDSARPGAPNYLAELLVVCEVTTLSLDIARQAGWLLRDSDTTDVVDAVVVAEALTRPRAGILTSDWGDLQRLLDASPDRLRHGVRILRV